MGTTDFTKAMDQATTAIHKMMATDIKTALGFQWSKRILCKNGFRTTCRVGHASKKRKSVKFLKGKFYIIDKYAPGNDVKYYIYPDWISASSATFTEKKVIKLLRKNFIPLG